MPNDYGEYNKLTHEWSGWKSKALVSKTFYLVSNTNTWLEVTVSLNMLSVVRAASYGDWLDMFQLLIEFLWGGGVVLGSFKGSLQGKKLFPKWYLNLLSLMPSHKYMTFFVKNKWIMFTPRDHYIGPLFSKPSLSYAWVLMA